MAEIIDLIEAIRGKINANKVKCLLKYCNDINSYVENGVTALHELGNFDLSQKECKEIFDLVIHNPEIDVNIRKFDGKTLLHLTESEEMVKELLKLGTVDLNIMDNKGNTPLMDHLSKLQYFNSSYYNNLQICIDLIKCGANINLMNFEGDSPILMLYKLYVTDDIEDIFQCIINHPEVNVNVKNRHGNTVLHLAESTLLVRYLLLSNNIDINAMGKSGNTPLLRNIYKICNLYKQQEPNPEIVEITKMLIDQGADINLCNDKGNGPIHMVQNLDISKIVYRDFFNYLTNHPLINVNARNIYGCSLLDLAEDKIIKAAVDLPFESILLIPAVKMNDKNVLEKVLQKWDKTNYNNLINDLIEYFRNDDKYGFFSLALWKFIYRHKDETPDDIFKAYFENVILYFMYDSIIKYPITLPEFELFMELYLKYTKNKFQYRTVQTIFLKFRDCRLLRKVIKNTIPTDLNKFIMQDDPFLFLLTTPQCDINLALQNLVPTCAEDYFFNIQHIARFSTLPIRIFEDFMEEGFEYGNINNALEEIGLVVFKPKSLKELSRDVARYYIATKMNLVNIQQMDLYLEQIEIPRIIKQILMLESPIHPQIALPVLVQFK